MKRRIEQLINGRYEYEVPKLLLSQDSIVLQTRAGENCRGELHLGAEDQRKIKGIAASSHRRFLLGKERFSGTTAALPYVVDVKGLKAGDMCEGTLTLSTDIGEYQVPFTVAILRNQVRTSVGEIRTLDQFVTLAKADFREAFHLFVDEAFAGLLRHEDEKLWLAYRGMSVNPVTYQHLEEFLIGIGKKEPIKLSLGRESVELYEVEGSLKDTLMLHRNGWGYVRAEVSVQGDFLEVEKKVITTEDFIGSVYGLEYIVRREYLGRGKNYGRIIVKTVYETQVFQVVASRHNKIQVNVSAYEKKKKYELARHYLEMSVNRIPFKEWYDKSLSLLEELKDTGYVDTGYELLEAYLYYRAGLFDKAAEVLEKLENSTALEELPEMEGCYLYLNACTGRLKLERRDYLKRLHTLSQMQEDSFILLWILLQEDSEAYRTPSKKLYELETQYEIGCRSPFLYLEAFRLIKENVLLFRKINRFYIQVLFFAKKYGLLTEEIVGRTAYLSGYLKSFHQVIYELMAEAYEQYPSRDLLDAVCKLLMKGNPRKKEYFKWYELAVEEELRITRLYEYYIETMSRNYQGTLPQVIRMYFAYNNTLSDGKKAFVYSNVIRNKSTDKNTYLSYKSAMKAFAWNKLSESRMNEDYAVLYQEFCMHPGEEKERAALAKVLFIHRLYLEDTKIRKVIVCHDALKKEEAYPCVDGVAYISVYTPDARILFEDEKRRRYMGTVDYNLQKLLDEKEAVSLLAASEVNHSGFLLHVCGGLDHSEKITKDNVGCFHKIVEDPSFQTEYRECIRQRILEYFQENVENDNLKDYLRQMDFKGFAKVNKSLLVKILVNQGMYVGAFDLLCEFGYEGVDTEVLLKLCSRMILNMEFEYEEELVLLGWYVYVQGKYDDIILHYLSMFYEGPAEEMARLWQSTQGFQIEAYELEEKILTYSMFARTYLPLGSKVLESYLKQAGKEQVILAYLTFEAFGYFLGGKETDIFIFQCLEKITEREWESDMICKLALLKWLSVTQDWNPEEEKLVRRLLWECSRMGLRFAFFQAFPKEYLRSYQLEDKVFAEYRAGLHSRVTLYYCLEEEGKAGDYKSEPLKEMYQGIYSKEFVLFYGEMLTYYFQAEKDGKTYTTEPRTITVTEVDASGDTKYQMLNQMLAVKKLGKEDELRNILKKYLEREAVIQQLFRITE